MYKRIFGKCLLIMNEIYELTVNYSWLCYCYLNSECIPNQTNTQLHPVNTTESEYVVKYKRSH